MHGLKMIYNLLPPSNKYPTIVYYSMPTGGKTKPIHVYEGIAAFTLAQKAASGTPVWMSIEKNLTDDFIIKYNNWVQNNPTAVDKRGQRFREIDKNDW